jgi:hypothetical protein
MTFLVLVCTQNLCGHHGPCLQIFYLHCQEILDSEFIHRSRKLSPSAEPRGCHTRQQAVSPQGTARDPSFWTECKIPDQIPKLLELKTLQCRKQTHERQTKSWQANFFWSKGCKHMFTPAEWTWKHKMVDSDFSSYSWCNCTSPYLGFVQIKDSQSLSIG